MGAETHAHARPDYTPWGSPRRWSSVREFTATDAHAEGAHRISVGSNDLDLFMIGTPLDAKEDGAVCVFLSGAVADRRGRPGPFFSGQRISRSLHLSALLLADPTLTDHDDVALGWYAGCELTPAQQAIADLLGAVADATGRPLLLIGGSGGGFAALCLADLVGRGTAVLCWNPQTDVLRYVPDEVGRFLASCYPSLARDQADQEQLRAQLAHAGVRTRLAEGPTSAGRVLYLQNVHDWHVQEHLLPFLARRGLEPASEGTWRGEGAVVALGAWGHGHAVPDRVVLEAALTALAKGGTATSALAAARAAAPEGFPRPGEVEAAEHPEFKWSAHVTGGRTVAARIGSHAARWSRFAFYLMGGSERLVVRWYGEEPAATFSTQELEHATHVICFVRGPRGTQTTVELPVPQTIGP